ncbi:MAG: DUF4296 domain-containing protein [Flavobacteriales bacterium]
MKKYSRFLVVFLLILSCTKRLEEPKDLLSKEQMRDILIEIGLSKNIPINLLDTLVRNSKDRPDKRFLEVLTNQSITLKRFKESHYYYTTYPEEYKSIFKMIKDSLNTKLNQLRIEDSLETEKAKIQKIELEKVQKTKSEEDLKKIDQQKKDSIMKPIKKKLDSLRKR